MRIPVKADSHSGNRKFIPLYLLLSIGYKGGQELAHNGNFCLISALIH